MTEGRRHLVLPNQPPPIHTFSIRHQTRPGCTVGPAACSEHPWSGRTASQWDVLCWSPCATATERERQAPTGNVISFRASHRYSEIRARQVQAQPTARGMFGISTNKYLYMFERYAPRRRERITARNSAQQNHVIWSREGNRDQIIWHEHFKCFDTIYAPRRTDCRTYNDSPDAPHLLLEEGHLGR